MPLYLIYVTAGKSKDPIVMDEYSKTQEPKTVCYQMYSEDIQDSRLQLHLENLEKLQIEIVDLFFISDRKIGKLYLSRILVFINITYP